MSVSVSGVLFSVGVCVCDLLICLYIARTHGRFLDWAAAAAAPSIGRIAAHLVMDRVEKVGLVQIHLDRISIGSPNPWPFSLYTILS